MTITGEYATREVKIGNQRLSARLSQSVYNHSPDGFNWGYGGSGPAQLALALLLDFGVLRHVALEHYQQFKWDVIAKIPAANFAIDSREIDNWIDANIERKPVND